MLYQHQPKVVLAEAPSFTLRKITDPISDWILSKGDLLKSSRGNSSTDISSVSYSSDGKTLNSTLWLSSPFDNKPASRMISYGLIVDTNLNQTTEIQPADYRISIRWENETQTWTKVFEQLGPVNQETGTAETITLDVQYNYSGFFEKGKSYVLLSADLNTIGSPDKYRVIFYTADKEDSASTIDLTNWIYIPQPELVISIFPNPVVIRPGEEKTVEIRLNSTSGFEPLVFLYTMAQSDLALNIGIDKLRMPSYGDATIPLTITASPNAATRPYTAPVFANISFPSQSILETISSETDLITNPSFLRSQNMTTVSSLTITVLEPLSIAAKYGYIISFLALIITTTLFTLQPLISKIVKFLPPTMDLKENTTFIIEIDAAVITGVLILISLQGIDLPRITGITATIIFPFAISVIVTLIHKEKLGTRLMIAGFINLMISIVLLALAII